MKRLALVLVVLALGCGEVLPPLTEGTVRERQFVAAHWVGGNEWTCDYHYSWSEGEYVYGCHDVYEAHHRMAPDAWRLKLEACGGPERKCRTSWVWVTREVFDRFEVGIHYPEPA